MCDILKTTGRRAKSNEMRDSGTPVTHMWCTFDLIVSKAIFWVIWCTCLKMVHKSKMTGH